MKKMIISTLLVAACFGCDGTASESSSGGLPLKGTIDNPNVSFFPRSSLGQVGDPIPYFDGEKMNVFYLLNEDPVSALGFHPWALLQTTDFAHYEDRGVVIPYEKNAASQDLALGTGSVIEKDGTYHVFYTGYNGTGNTDYFEKIQHATSTDLIHWTKIPADGFYGGQNDFRDPHVLYMENESLYWMLITTRDNGAGVLKLFKSPDLKTWTYHSVFFRNDDGAYNMECPTLVRFGNYWYLSFSEQGSLRVTHYRYRESLTAGSWIKPENDFLDGRGVYAGKMEKAFGNLYMIGWQAVKQYDYDGGDFDWGGNLVTHQIQQQTNGELRPMPATLALNQVNHEVSYPLIKSSAGVTSDANGLSFSADNYQYALYDSLEAKATTMAFDLDIQGYSGKLGLTFGAKSSATSGGTNIVLDLDTQSLDFYNVKPDVMNDTFPQASVPLSIGYGDHLNLRLLSENECLTVYIEGQFALSVRMYEKTDRLFGWFSLGTAFSVNNAYFAE